MIYYDPTEARDSTRLHESVIDSGQVLPGLEQLTGADLLIVPEPLGVVRVGKDMPAILLQTFATACREGILVARKSGTDLLSSLDSFNAILIRMLEWEPSQAWLLSTGTIRTLGNPPDGKVAIGTYESTIRYDYLDSRLTLWEDRGGYYRGCANDEWLAQWVLKKDSWCGHISPERIVFPRRPKQRLVRPTRDELTAHKLTAVPGIGMHTALAMVAYLPENRRDFWDVLMYFGAHDAPDGKPKGVGTGTLRRIREWLT